MDLHLPGKSDSRIVLIGTELQEKVSRYDLQDTMTRIHEQWPQAGAPFKVDKERGWYVFRGWDGWLCWA